VLHQELGRKSFTDMRWEELWDAALRIRNRFERSPVPEEVVAALEARWPFGREARLAVRSSAPGEDSSATSFAGLHDSFVGVRGLEATLEAVREVWASLQPTVAKPASIAAITHTIETGGVANRRNCRRRGWQIFERQLTGTRISPGGVAGPRVEQ
jgi:hypothetical protein